MISQEQALSRIRGMAAEEIHQLTKARLLGRDVAPIGGGYLDEPPEDLVIQLLRNPALPQDFGAAVLGGCMEVYGELLSRLASLGQTRLEEEWPGIAVRLCRVVDVVSPPELQSHADSLLTLALANRQIESDVIRAAARASMGYELSEVHVPLWKNALERREIAPYGFGALRKINPDAERIVQSLKFLWRRQILDGWDVDTPFLMRRAARNASRLRVVPRVVLWLRKQRTRLPGNRTFWSEASRLLGARSWSKPWLAIDSSSDVTFANLVSFPPSWKIQELRMIVRRTDEQETQKWGALLKGDAVPAHKEPAWSGVRPASDQLLGIPIYEKDPKEYVCDYAREENVFKHYIGNKSADFVVCYGRLRAAARHTGRTAPLLTSLGTNSYHDFKKPLKELFRDRRGRHAIYGHWFIDNYDGNEKRFADARKIDWDSGGPYRYEWYPNET